MQQRGVVGIAAQPRLSDQSGVIARLLKRLREDQIVRIFAHLQLTVSAHIGVSAMLPFEQATTRRAAHRAPGIVIRKTNPLIGHTIEVRGLYHLLPIATQVAVAEVIGQNVNDIGPVRHSFSDGGSLSNGFTLSLCEDGQQAGGERDCYEFSFHRVFYIKSSPPFLGGWIAKRDGVVVGELRTE